MEDKDLEACLVAAVKELFSGPGRDDLSVNTVRTKCEKENGLEEGFFARGEWKTKSKELIKNQVVRHEPPPSLPGSKSVGPRARPELTPVLTERARGEGRERRAAFVASAKSERAGAKA
jgi:hypothetical protein